MTPTITIPLTALALLQKDGYHARYHHHLGEGKTCPQAWEAVEVELYATFQIHRYRNYETFRATMTRWNRRKSK
jgi:hypothetical protein